MKFIVLLALIGIANAAFQIGITKVASRRTRLMKAGLWSTYSKYKEARRLQNKAAILTSVSQPVNDYDDSEYVGNITIGTPEQSFVVVLDTASAILWIPDISCTTCGYGFNQNKNNSFDQTKSSTYQVDGRSFLIYTSGGDVTGFLGVDTVRFGAAGTTQLVVPNSTFGQVNFNNDFHVTIDVADGVLGLAFPALLTNVPGNTVVPPLINAINQGLLDQPIFTVYLKEKGIVDNVPGGVFTYGGFDTQNCGPLIAWQPLSSVTYFQFRMSSIGAGSYSNSNGWNVISDTSVSFIGGPEVILDALANAVGASKYVDAEGGIDYFIDCNATSPPISVVIGSNTYYINEKQMKIHKYGAPDCYWAVTPMGSSGGFGYNWVLGDPFIRQYCNIYDLGGKRIGFAPAIGA